MNGKQLNAIKKELDAQADPVRASHSLRFFKTGPGQYGEGDVFIGITMPALRKVCKNYRDLSIADLRELLASKVHEHRMAAVVIMADVFKKSSPTRQDDIYNLYMQGLRKNQINNWDIIDVSCPHIIGEYLLDKPADPLYDLAKSDHLWSKRVAIISTFMFLKYGNATDTIRISEILLHDAHDLIQKAVGWALREVGKTAGEETLTVFLDKHAGCMPRTMLRYSIEKLSTKQRQHYLAIKGDKIRT